MTRPASVVMPGAATAVKAASPAPGVTTEAGRVAEQYAAQHHAVFHEAIRTAVAAAEQTGGARPSKSRARAAQQQGALGTRFAQQRQYPQAITAFRRAIELDPALAEVHHNLGYVCLQIGRLEDAAVSFSEAVRLKPDLAGAQHYLAMALDQLGRRADALRAYEATIRLEPQRAAAQFRFGQLCLASYRWADAEAAFRAAAAAGIDPLMQRVATAYAAHAAGDDVTAEALLRAVIADAPEYSWVHVVLGDILAQSGALAEAAACLERGISLDPREVASWYSFARSWKFAATDEALIRRIGACLERTDLTPSQRRAVHFALGKAHDDIGDYREAMRHFDAGNHIRAAAAPLDRATVVQWSSRIIDAAPAGFLERRPDLGVEDATPILIVGMPRSGTTLVEQILSSHPQIAAAGELPFWTEKAAAGVSIFGATAVPGTVRRLAGEYLAVLRGNSPDAARVTDKMPFNFQSLGVFCQAFPYATIVHCRRAPIDTCLSVFTTDFEWGFEFAGDRASLVFYYRQYQRLMAHWREVLPRDRFIELDYETLVADPEPLTRQLIAACGLEWDDACLAPQRNPGRISTVSLWQARQPIYRTSVERWRRYEPWLGALRELLPAAGPSPE
ncbi:MAG TPA: sulfotransferase [Acetobacteraceae bacterium]|jgi:tetratricopeptide (TPR) repeat protein